MIIDFQADTDGSILVANGDFVISNATASVARVILFASKGEIRNDPNLGFNLELYVGSSISDAQLFSAASEELAKAGIQLVKLTVDRQKTNSLLTLEVN